MDALGNQGIGLPVTEVVAVEADLLTDEQMLPADQYGDLPLYLKERWEICRDGKRNIHTEWQEAFRDFKGVYSPEVESEIGEDRSKAFVKLTRAETCKGMSLILQTMGLDHGYPYSIRPTANPDLGDQDLSVLKEAALLAASQVAPEERDAFLAQNDFEGMAQAEKGEAIKRMEKMRREINDSLDEMGWKEKFLRGLVPFTIYGTAVFQGPLSATKRPSRWSRKGDSWKKILKTLRDNEEQAPFDLRPDMRQLDPFTVYPDPCAIAKEDMLDVFVRNVMNRHQVRELRRRHGFDAESIDRILANHEKGDWVMEDWETVVESDSAQANRLNDRFLVLEYWGWLSGQTLQDAGIDIPEDQLEVDCLVNVWTLCGEIVKLSVSNKDVPALPFYFVPYEVVPGRVWGRGIPKQMDDSQAIYNATERAKVDNMAFSVGPITVVDASKVKDSQSLRKLLPLSVLPVNDMEGLSQQPIQFFQPKSNVPEMTQIQQSVRWHLQKETSIPDFAIGVPGSAQHNRTAEGLGMQQNAAMSFIKTVIGNIDTFLISPMVEDLYDWHMQFNPDEDIKGDYEVVATGVQGAISRELTAQKLIGVLQVFAQPDLAHYPKYDKIGAMLGQTLGLYDLDLIHTEKEAEAIRQQKLQANSEIENQPKKIQPVMPPVNALVQMLQNTPEGSPLYGPTYQSLLMELGYLNDPELGPRYVGALNAVNEISARNVQNLINAQDAGAIAKDLQMEMPNAEQPQPGIPGGAPGEVAPGSLQPSGF